MLKKCPYCNANFDEGKEYFICPYCNEELPKDETKADVNYDVLKSTRPIEIREAKKKKRGFFQAWHDYELNRAHINKYIAPIEGVIFIILGIVLIFYSWFGLFFIIIGVIFILIGIWLKYLSEHFDE